MIIYTCGFTCRSFYKLQAAGVHGGGPSPEAVRLFPLAVKPTLTYGAHAIHLTNADLHNGENACPNRQN